MKRTLIAAAVVAAIAGFGLAVQPGHAQQKDAAKPADKAPPKAEAKKEEEPFWAVGRPKGDVTAKMAPVPAFPIATAADKLPVKKIKLPPGFKAEVYQADLLDARGMREGDKGTVFVSSLFVAGKIYAISTGKDGKRTVKTIAEKLFLPNGIEFYKGALYVATPKDITRYDGIEDKLDSPPKPVMVYDKLPGDVPHGWKFIKMGPDNKLYVPIGAPCNICEPDVKKGYTTIIRMNPDGSGVETVLSGMRNTVGFDWHPKTRELWFGDNQRDWLAEDMPQDELNRVTKTGENFGYPYCHSGIMTDPQFGWGKDCKSYAKPALLIGPHAAPLGMRFYTGKMFPAKYQNAIFLTRHGPWNKTEKYAADVVAVFIDEKGNAKMEPFLTGLVENNQYLGRPADVLVMKDGSLLVSDDHNGAIYRITYGK
jgi:glucose/arabinose dehydrogenase